MNAALTTPFEVPGGCRGRDCRDPAGRPPEGKGHQGLYVYAHEALCALARAVADAGPGAQTRSVSRSRCSSLPRVTRSLPDRRTGRRSVRRARTCTRATRQHSRRRRDGRQAGPLGASAARDSDQPPAAALRASLTLAGYDTAQGLRGGSDRGRRGKVKRRRGVLVCVARFHLPRLPRAERLTLHSQSAVSRALPLLALSALCATPSDIRASGPG